MEETNKFKYFLDYDYYYDVLSKIENSNYLKVKPVELQELSKSFIYDDAYEIDCRSFIQDFINDESLETNYHIYAYQTNNLDVFLLFKIDNEEANVDDLKIITAFKNMQAKLIDDKTKTKTIVKTIKFIKKISKNIIKIVF